MLELSKNAVRLSGCGRGSRRTEIRPVVAEVFDLIPGGTMKKRMSLTLVAIACVAGAGAAAAQAPVQVPLASRIAHYSPDNVRMSASVHSHFAKTTFC